ASDRVIQLVALPAVPAGDRKMERALGGHHDQHRPDRQRAQLGTGTTRTRPAFLLPPPRRERRSRAGSPHLISLEPTGPCVKAAGVTAQIRPCFGEADGRSSHGRDPRPGTALIAAIADAALHLDATAVPRYVR